MPLANLNKLLAVTNDFIENTIRYPILMLKLDVPNVSSDTMINFIERQ